MSAVGLVDGLWQVVPAAHRRRAPALVGLMVAAGLAELTTLAAVMPFLAMLADPLGLMPHGWIGRLARLAGASDRGEALAAVTLMFALAALLSGALRLWLAWTSQRFVMGLGHSLMVEVQRRLLHQPYAYHLKHHSASAVAMLEKVDLFAFGAVQPLLSSASALVIGAAIVTALMLSAPLVAIATIASLLLVYVALAIATRRRIRVISTTLATGFEERVRIVQDSFGAVRDVILDDLQGACLERFRASDAQVQASRADAIFLASAPRFLIDTVGMITVALLALLLSRGGGGLAQALPTLGVIALGGQRLLPLAQMLYSARTQLAANLAITNELRGLLALPAGDPGKPPAPMPFEREIRVENLRFTYPGRSRPAIDDASLVIPRGGRVALVGETGGGKTTLADLLMGLIVSDGGAILIDGRPLGPDNARAWQRDIGHVSQAIFLADDSIARNIAFGAREVDQARVAKAAAIAQLADFIASLDEGYDTRVGERGVRLSGGQRQRLGIARAIYKGAPMLILDEATSAVDDATEAAILGALDVLSADGLTLLIIAHRSSTIAACDRVYRVEQGRVSEA